MAKALAMKELRDSRAYETLGLTWDQFCPQHLGICRATADAIIRNYTELGSNYFRLSEICRISPDTFQSVAPNIAGDAIELDGETIALTAENAHKIRAGIRRLHQDLKTALNSQSTVLADFYHRIDALCRDIHKFHVNRVGRAEHTGLSTVVRYAKKQMHALLAEIETAEPAEPPT
jgi:hypothetical protein